MAEWLERRAEEHICPHCAGSKPARDNVMTCQSEKGRDDIYMNLRFIMYNMLTLVNLPVYLEYE